MKKKIAWAVVAAGVATVVFGTAIPVLGYFQIQPRKERNETVKR